MTPTAAKLLMCVCAGSTGAVMVPAAHKVRAMARPAVSRTAHVTPSVAAAAPCPPAVASSLGGGGAGLPGGSAQPGLTELSSAPGFDAFGGGSLYGGGQGGGGGFSGGGGGFGAGGGLGGGGGGGGPGTTAPPIITPMPGGTSSAADAATWAMMISGFGIIGSAMRWQRKPSVA